MPPSLARSYADIEVPRMDKNELKQVTKEALKEWLDEKFIVFGKWTITTVLAAALAALTYFILWANNWVQK
jgi:hypothetical protein